MILSQPQISLNPGSLSFGPVAIDASVKLNAKILNTGVADLSISNIVSTSSKFSFELLGSTTVPAGSEVILSVIYQPTDEGEDTGSLVITSNASNSPTTLQVSGTGVVSPPGPPDMKLDPSLLNFSSVTVGGSKTLTATIENRGGTDLVVNHIALCVGTVSDFSFSPLAVPFTVPPGDIVSLTVTYAPLNASNDTGCIEIMTNDPESPTAKLALTGKGVVTPQGEVLDLDIKAFRATPKTYNISAKKMVPVKFSLTVENRSRATGTATAILVGVQNGMTVYENTIPLQAPPKVRGRRCRSPRTHR